MSTALHSPCDLLVQAEALLKARDLEPAWAACKRAGSAGADPDNCSGARWMIAMLRGDFDTAWRESDAIRDRGKPDPHRFWMGQDFTDKRVVLRCLHGCGDTVQMMRYVPLVAERARSLVIEAAPAMLELIAMFDGVFDVVTWGAQAPKIPPRWDAQIEINELPYVFRTQAVDLPLAKQYLRLPKGLEQTVDARAHRPGNLRVGLLWSSGEWKTSRSVSPSLLHPLLAMPGVEFWNLQGGSSRAEWECFKPGPHLHKAEECAGSIARLAALIAQLDLVITPDTLAAHLAGALGTPAWVMLEYAADWRWQHARSDSPWYPSLRLFRQAEAQDWNSVVNAIKSQLLLLVSRCSSERLVA